MKTCISYSHRFESECGRILLLRLNKLERSNRTPNHLFVCKFEKNIETTKIYVKNQYYHPRILNDAYNSHKS